MAQVWGSSSGQVGVSFIIGTKYLIIIWSTFFGYNTAKKKKKNIQIAQVKKEK